MIVCNESRVIRRALESVRGIIDYWVICDTGSGDSTPMEIWTTLAGIPGELYGVEWVNFGHNRADALRRAHGKADYILILDADMVANVGAPFKHLLTADSYEIRYTGLCDYSQRMLVADRHEWTYIGVTHECIYSPTARIDGSLPELTLTHFGDGGMRFDKFERDRYLLTHALAEDPKDARNAFYLAQTYRDLGQPQEALEWYEKRIALPGWDEETWYALFQAAEMKRRLGVEWSEVQQAFLRAYAFRPSRLEPLYAIVKYYREREEFALGYTFAAQAGHWIGYPDDRLFIDKPIYEYLFQLEYGACAYGAGRISASIEAFNEVIRSETAPPDIREAARRGNEIAVTDLYQTTECRLHPTPSPRADKRNSLVVLVPFHNPGACLEPCLSSLFEQDYPDFRVLLFDDASTDGSYERLPSRSDRFTIVRSHFRRGAAHNLHLLLTEYCATDDIVVCLDGDDRLAAPDAVSHVNRCYNRYDCWVLYSQFRFANGDPGFSQPFASPRDLSSAREYFRTSHLRTFRAGLFHRIAAFDRTYSCLKDEAGQWLDSAVDAALMCPLVEMAGFDRVRFTPRILYVYNDCSPLNHHRISPAKQADNFDLVRSKRPFPRVADYRGAILAKQFRPPLAPGLTASEVRNAGRQ
ncbi:MAG: glycosyltransferase [Acidobacteriaceae bacterium]|nr:glycosyltransferase [Acidobacteriaceae bacterium]